MDKLLENLGSAHSLGVFSPTHAAGLGAQWCEQHDPWHNRGNGRAGWHSPHPRPASPGEVATSPYGHPEIHCQQGTGVAKVVTPSFIFVQVMLQGWRCEGRRLLTCMNLSVIILIKIPLPPSWLSPAHCRSITGMVPGTEAAQLLV